jgi:O-succinylbenzoate synthase
VRPTIRAADPAVGRGTDRADVRVGAPTCVRHDGSVTDARIRTVELRRVSMVLRSPVVTAYGSEHARDVVLVRVGTDDGEGWGECAALPEPTYHPEYVAGALHVLVHHLAPRLLGAPAHESTLDERLAPVVGHRMAKAALEMAVLDARLRAAGRSFAAELGARAGAVPVGRMLGLERDLGRLRDEATAAAAAGYRHLKLKIVPGWDVEPVRAVRSDHPGVTVGADANGSYDPAELGDEHAEGRVRGTARGVDGGRWAEIDALGLLALEQPFPVDALADHARLAARMVTTVALDEDVDTPAAGRDALARAAADALVVKPGRLGGLRAALALGRAAGGRAWVGGMYETGVGRAANLALAACTDAFALPVDWSASDRYWETDLTEPHLLRPDGTIAVPSGPGLGVTPEAALLSSRTRERHLLRA